MCRAVRFSTFRFCVLASKNCDKKIKPLQEAKPNVVAVVPACPTRWDFSHSPKTLLFNFKSSSVSRNSETGSRYMGVVPVQSQVSGTLFLFESGNVCWQLTKHSLPTSNQSACICEMRACECLECRVPYYHEYSDITSVCSSNGK